MDRLDAAGGPSGPFRGAETRGGMRAKPAIFSARLDNVNERPNSFAPGRLCVSA
jgi:hypothetical protein